MRFCNLFLEFQRDEMLIRVQQYVTKNSVSCRYYVNGIGENLLALMTQDGKNYPKWSLYNCKGKKIKSIFCQERVVYEDLCDEFNFHEKLIDWALEESKTDMDSRAFLENSGYKSFDFRSINDPWKPIDFNFDTK